MLLRLESVQRMPLVCLDGTEGGTIEDFLFDEEYGTVRFVSVVAGRGAECAPVLISARALRLRGDRLEMGYRSEALCGSTDRRPRPTWRRPHHASGRAAGATRLRTPGFALPPAVPRTSLQRSAHHSSHGAHSNRHRENAPDVSLRSFQSLQRARVLTDDRDVGQLDDFVVSQEDWTLRHLVVALDPAPATEHDAAGEPRRVLVGLSWVRDIDWDAPSLHVDLPHEQLLASPPLDSRAVVPHEFERQVYDFHVQR